MTFGQASSDFFSNNFDFMRFVGASLVILSHAYLLLGFKEPLVAGGVVIGGFGVFIFFIISGFLVARSWESHPRATAFLGKRLLRIFPGLIVVTLLSVFILGPIFTHLSLIDYLRSPGTLNYFSNLSLLSYAPSPLPGVAFGSAQPFIVNASLWTLKYEMLAYIMLAIFAYGGLFRRKRRMITDFAVLLLIVLVASSLFKLIPAITFYDLVPAWIIRFGGFFAAGVLFYLHRAKIPYSWKLALAGVVIYLPLRFTPLEPYVGLLVLPYIILYLGLLPTKHLKNFARHGDYSYGIYIFGYPVQQAILSTYLHIHNPHKFAVLSFVLAIPFGVASWFLIEKPALSHKKRLSKVRYPVDEVPVVA